MTDFLDLSTVDPEASVVLTVGWRTGRKLRLKQMLLGERVTNEFKQVVAGTLDNLAQRDSEIWTPDADLTPETYLTLTTAQLGAAPVLATEHGELTLSQALLAPEALPLLDPHELPAANLELYAITVGDIPGERTAFLRRNNPRRGLRAGRIYTSYRDVLQNIDDPVFGFDRDIDLVFLGDQVHVLSQATFAALFRDQEALAGQIPSWTAVLGDHVPLEAAGRDRLNQRALRDSRIARRLESIVTRGHLADVSIDELRDKMTEVGLDPDAHLDSNGQLSLEDEHISTVLNFLNEDLFYGVITQIGFRADRKAPR